METTDEIANKLPAYIKENGVIYELLIGKGSSHWYIEYSRQNNTLQAKSNETLTGALDSMLSWLTENAYLVET